MSNNGFLVAFWSPLHGRGTTANCIAAASQFSYKYNTDVYITHTHYNRSMMEKAFLNEKKVDEDLLSFSDLGLDSIERALQTGKLMPGDFKSYCNKINETLYLLSGSKKANYTLFNNTIGQTFEKICEFSKENNGITFVDVESGFTRDIACKVIEAADVVVVNLDQTNFLCEEYFNRENEHRIPEEKEIIVIGRFDYESKYTKKYIDNTFKQDSIVIPHLTDYLDALNNHRVKGFFDSYNVLEDELFFDEINRLNEKIVEKAKANNILFEKKNIVTSQNKKSRIFFGRR